MNIKSMSLRKLMLFQKDLLRFHQVYMRLLNVDDDEKYNYNIAIAKLNGKINEAISKEIPL